MNCDKENLIDFVFDNDNMQFIIPVYQRNYDWKIDNCLTLLNDVIDACRTNKTHFMGSFVVCNNNDYESGVNIFTIIDGQQRLTTLYLFLKALEVLCVDDADKDLLDSYIFNNKNTIPIENRAKYKLRLKSVISDQKQLELLFDDRFEELDKKSNIYINFNFFRESINKFLDEGNISIKNFLNGLRLLEFVLISLDKHVDDPQIIFERINSTGVDLKLSDLVRNYLLMTEQSMDDLYKNYWLPMEEKVSKDKLNDYLKTYMIYKLPEANDNNSYDVFKKYMSEGNHSHEEILSELKKYSKYYAVLTGVDKKPEDSYSKKNIITIRNFDYLNNTTIFPLLFSIFDDFDSNRIDENTFISILQFFFVYLVRRTIAGIPSNSLRGLFKGLYKRVFPNGYNPETDNYLESFYDQIAKLSKRDGICSDEKVIDAIMNSDLYNSNKITFCNFLLATLENTSKNNNEYVSIDSDITIEHIMPQTLSAWWRNEIRNTPEIYETHLHHLGNLSLTGVNRQLSNEPFPDKKTEYLRTRFTYLYEDVTNREHWGLKEINERGLRLAKQIVKLFPIPNYLKEKIVNDNETSSNNNLDIFLDDDYDYKGSKPEYFVFQGIKYEVKNNKEILTSICDILYSLDSSCLFLLANKAGMDKIETSKYAFISLDAENFNSPREINESGIYVETNRNANSIFKCIKLLLDKYGISYDEFFVHLLEPHDSD